MNHPAILSKTRYKIGGSEVPWSEDEYLKFLQRFYEFFNVPTNNKKIAMLMGKNIEPNHVKHVKGIFMRNMSARIESGEIGGGKKGIFESKLDFLKKDIENFSMKYFKKETKARSKKTKKKKKKLSLGEDDDDSDFWYLNLNNYRSIITTIFLVSWTWLLSTEKFLAWFFLFFIFKFWLLLFF